MAAHNGYALGVGLLTAAADCPEIVLLPVDAVAARCAYEHGASLSVCNLDRRHPPPVRSAESQDRPRGVVTTVCLAPLQVYV